MAEMSRRLLPSVVIVACWLRAAALQAGAHSMAVGSYRPARGCCSMLAPAKEELAIDDDIFELVGVSPTAAPAEIRRAFHRQARKLHPDCNTEPEAPREFRRLVAAFKTISDPQSRQQWERKRRSANGRTGFRVPKDVKRQPAADSYVSVPGGSLRTWSFRLPSMDLVQVVLGNEGCPLDADIEVWHGATHTPCKMRVHTIKDGKQRPFSAVLEVPENGPNTVAVRNNGQYDFPLTTKVVHDKVDTPADCTASSTIIPGEAFHQYSPFEDPAIDSVQVVLKTGGAPLSALIEVRNGPDDVEQVVELNFDETRVRPFFCVLKTPGSESCIRIVNLSPVGFPLDASVVPLGDAKKPLRLKGPGGVFDAIRAEMEMLYGLADQARQAAHAADKEKVKRLVRREAELKAKLDEVAAQANAETEAMAKANADSHAARAEAELLSVDLNNMMTAADAIKGELEARVQVAQQAQKQQKSAAYKAEKPPRNAAERQERRAEAKLKKEEEARMAEFVTKAEAGWEETEVMRTEIEEIAQGMESSAAEAARQEAELLRAEQDEMTTVMEASQARVTARVQTAAEQAVAAVENERLKSLEDGDEVADADANAEIVRAQETEEAEAELLRVELDLRAAMNDVETVRVDMEQRLKLAVKVRQTAARLELKKRTQLRARLDDVKTKLSAIAAMANDPDAGAPPDVHNVISAA